MTDDRQRLRREAVDAAINAQAADANPECHGGVYAAAFDALQRADVPGILAMESLLTEAEATIAEQAKEIERLDAACSLEAADAEGLREEMADARHTIAEQAKEIERLRGCEGCRSCGLAYPWHAVGCHFCPEGRAYDDQ